MTWLRSAIRTAALVAFALLLGRPAHAQTAVPTAGSFSIGRFDPTPVGDRFEAVRGSGIAGEELPRAGFTLDYARAPLIVRSAPSPIVHDELIFHASMSLALWERVLLSASLPMVLLDRGGSVTVPGNPPRVLSAPNSADIGDIDLGVRLRLVGADNKAAGLALGGEFWLPSGQPTEFTGTPGFRAMPHVSVSGTLPWFVYAGHAGVLIQRSQDFVDVHLGPELQFGAAAAFVPSGGRVQIGPEFLASVPLQQGDGDTKALPSAELLGSLRLRFDKVLVGAESGAGLIRGVGTPSFRVITTLAYSPVREADSDKDGIINLFDACPRVVGQADDDPARNGCPSDRDADGILDAVDRCPDEPGVRSTDPHLVGCPVPTDRDQDGIADEVDACPDTKGPPNKNPKKNGCPSDKDGDGIVDDEDACPDVAGVDNADPKKKGCPADTDGDGIADAEDACPRSPGIPSPDPTKNGCPLDTDGDKIPDPADACPHERGPANADPQQNGCPVGVRFTAVAIELTTPIPFSPGSARITKAVEVPLKAIVSVLADHPEVHRVAVEGAPGYEALRASLVVRWLSTRGGVAANRLEFRSTPGARTLRFRIVNPAPASPAP